jgi:hypothetical protein
MVVNYDNNCYYKINPYDLENMEYTSQEDFNNFLMIYMAKVEFENNTANNIWASYYNLVVEYRANLMEKEVEEMTAVLQQL